MANGRENIYKSCWGTALAAHNRLLKITATDQLARDMDSQWARANDPFNSVHRLPPIVTKCGASNDNRMWVLRHMCHMATHLSVSVSSSDFSVDGLPGARPDPDPATGSCSEKRPSSTSATRCRSNLGSRATPAGLSTALSADVKSLFAREEQEHC